MQPHRAISRLPPTWLVRLEVAFNSMSRACEPRKRSSSPLRCMYCPMPTILHICRLQLSSGLRNPYSRYIFTQGAMNLAFSWVLVPQTGVKDHTVAHQSKILAALIPIQARVITWHYHLTLFSQVMILYTCWLVIPSLSEHLKHKRGFVCLRSIMISAKGKKPHSADLWDYEACTTPHAPSNLSIRTSSK
jgi:hypothetical protein